LFERFGLKKLHVDVLSPKLIDGLELIFFAPDFSCGFMKLV